MGDGADETKVWNERFLSFGKWQHVWHLSSDFCLLSSGRYDCDCQKLSPFGVPCGGAFVVEAGLCISGSR